MGLLWDNQAQIKMAIKPNLFISANFENGKQNVRRKVDPLSINKIDEIQLISSQTVEDASKEAVMIKR